MLIFGMTKTVMGGPRQLIGTGITVIHFLDIIHRPVFSLKTAFSGKKPTQSGPISRANLYLRTLESTPDRVYKPNST
jgi:hypothetical protein